jgi:hypothetical protein
MSDTSQGPGWWLASDGKWYPPELWTGPPQYPGQSGPYGGSPYPSGYGRPVSSGRATPAKTNGLAIASLVCSCAGLFLLPVIPGIVFGFVARAQISRSAGAQRGDGLALAGIIVGFGWVALFVLGLVLDASRSNNGVVSAFFLAHLVGLVR